MGKKTEKFLFDQHIFDEPEEDEEEFEEPPPPTFSEEELETVRQKADQEAYERGKADGVAESKASREQMVAQVLQQIGQDASILFTNEEHRDKTFERESVQLALSIFEKLFPEEKGKHGFESLKNTISEILQRQENQSEIRIEVHPDAVDFDGDGEYELLAGADQGRVWYWKPSNFGVPASGNPTAPYRTTNEPGLGKIS